MGRAKGSKNLKNVKVFHANAGQHGKFAQAAQELRDGRIVDDTKYQYGLKIETMKRWFRDQEEYKDVLDLFNEEGELIIPVQTDRVLNFFGYLTTKFENVAFIEEVNTDFLAEATLQGKKVKKLRKQLKIPKKKRVAYSYSLVRGFKSALVWYTGSGGLPKECDTALEELLDGYKRRIARLKESGQMEIREGKSRLLFQGFSIISKAAMTSKPAVVVEESERVKLKGGRKLHPRREGTWQQFIFAWCFFVLEWVMMCRCATTAAILFSLMSWAGDCICIDVARSKSDQTGEKEFPRHVYANPYMPWLCPFLSLAVYIFCLPFKDSQSDSLFPGESQKDRFSKNLQGIVENLDEVFINQLGGTTVEDIGTHSTRKGSVSYVLSLAGGPNVIQVFLRCCWSLGNVQDRYVFLDSGGDQFVGRSVGGLPVSDSKFATLPPHLSSEDLEEISKLGWEQIVPAFYNFNPSFRVIIQYLFASIVFHVDFLREELSPAHPLFQTAAFTRGWVDKYRGRILLGEGRCLITGMVASGVPPNVKILTEMQELKAELRSAKAEIVQTRTDLISRFDQVANSLPGAVAKEFSESFNVEGHTPLTIATVQKLIFDVRDELLGALKQTPTQPSIVVEPIQTALNEPSILQMQYSCFSWINPLDRDKKNKGQPKTHPVPSGFLLPRASASDCWTLWHFGHKALNYAPYRGITCRDLDIRAEWGQLSRIRCVMDSLLGIAVKNNHIGEGIDVKSLSEPDSHAVFEKSFKDLLTDLHSCSKSTGQSYGVPSIGRIYNLIKEKEGQLTSANK